MPLLVLGALGIVDGIHSLHALRGNPLRPAWETGLTADGSMQGPLRPGVRWKRRTPGDLAEISRIAALEEWRTETGVADAWGFRNPPSDPERPAEIVLLGDSFLDGSEGECFRDYLEKATGKTVYAYHGIGLRGMKPSEFLADPRFRNAPPRWVILERVERGVESWWIRDRSAPPRRAGCGSWLDCSRRWRDRWSQAGESRVLGWLQRIAATGRYRLTGEIPPSLAPFDSPTEMVFLKESVSIHALSPEERGLAEVLQGLSDLDSKFRARKIGFALLMVPDKVSIYGGEDPVVSPEDGLVLPALRFRHRLGEGLKEAGVPYLDLFPAFRKHAAEGGVPLYYRTDTHWAPPGRELGARESARQLKVLEAPR